MICRSDGGIGRTRYVLSAPSALIGDIMSILGSSAVSDTAFIKEIAHKIAECAPCSGNNGGAPRSFEAIVVDVGK